MQAPDPAFADPRLAALYDVFDDDREDLDAYVAIAAEVSATRVVDIGCGTGSLAVRLAAGGLAVVGVDPAGASLEVASRKPYADLVTWVHGDATALGDRDLLADLVVTRTVTRVSLPLVSFETTTTVGGEVVRSSSTLRFRGRDEVEADLAAHGFEVVDLREAPDRPGKELVFLARSSG